MNPGAEGPTQWHHIACGAVTGHMACVPAAGGARGPAPPPPWSVYGCLYGINGMRAGSWRRRGTGSPSPLVCIRLSVYSDTMASIACVSAAGGAGGPAVCIFSVCIFSVSVNRMRAGSWRRRGTGCPTRRCCRCSWRAARAGTPSWTPSRRPKLTKLISKIYFIQLLFLIYKPEPRVRVRLDGPRPGW